MALFGFERKRKKKLKETWPKNEDGTQVAPAFLTHTGGAPLDAELVLNLLQAYGIPTLCQYPNDGSFGQIMVGVAGGGVDIFVPETMLEDAKNLLNADIAEEDGELEPDSPDGEET
jgi:hypothetical protein